MKVYKSTLYYMPTLPTLGKKSDRKYVTLDQFVVLLFSNSLWYKLLLF